MLTTRLHRHFIYRGLYRLTTTTTDDSRPREPVELKKPSGGCNTWDKQVLRPLTHLTVSPSTHSHKSTPTRHTQTHTHTVQAGPSWAGLGVRIGNPTCTSHHKHTNKHNTDRQTSKQTKRENNQVAALHRGGSCGRPAKEGQPLRQPRTTPAQLATLIHPHTYTLTHTDKGDTGQTTKHKQGERTRNGRKRGEGRKEGEENRP